MTTTQENKTNINLTEDNIEVNIYHEKCLSAAPGSIPILLAGTKQSGARSWRACARAYTPDPTIQTTTERGEVTRARVRRTDEPNRVSSQQGGSWWR